MKNHQYLARINIVMFYTKLLLYISIGIRMDSEGMENVSQYIVYTSFAHESHIALYI